LRHGRPQRKLFAISVYPEVNHTQHGREIIANFLAQVAAPTTWTPGSMVAEAVAKIRAQVGERQSAGRRERRGRFYVAAALVHKAVGDQLTCFYIDTGLMRSNESEEVIAAFRENLRAPFIRECGGILWECAGGPDRPRAKAQDYGEKFIRMLSVRRGGWQ